MEEIKITVSIKRAIVALLITAAYIAVMFGFFFAGSDHKVLETIILAAFGVLFISGLQLNGKVCTAKPNGGLLSWNRKINKIKNL